MTHANPHDPHRDVAVLIFARAPRPGRCKTRLASGTGTVRAARLYAAMLDHTVACARAQNPARVVLACTPDIRHPLFARLARRHGVHRWRQPAGGLGQRMQAGVRAALARHAAVLIMGSDQPDLMDTWFVRARQALAQPDGAWLARARDGGYWAIALARREARPFHGPAWSTPRVAAQTLRRLHRCGLRPAVEPARPDVDTARDWQRLPQALRTALARRATMPSPAIGR